MKKIAILMALIGTGCILYPLWIIEPITVTVVGLGFILCVSAGYLFVKDLV